MQDEIKDLAEKDERSQKRIIDLILNEGEVSLAVAFDRLWDEQQEERRKETEEKERTEQKRLHTVLEKGFIPLSSAKYIFNFRVRVVNNIFYCDIYLITFNSFLY